MVATKAVMAKAESTNKRMRLKCMANDRVVVLGRVLINRQLNADLDVPLNVRYWGKADMARICQYVRK